MAKTIATLANYELRASLRNRWFLLYALVFALLSVALSSLSLSGAGMFGFAGFGRTAASLINLVLLVVPLMGLTVGAQSLAGEREQGTLSYLLAQPVGRAEVLIGKLLGLSAALLAALMLGFGLAARRGRGRSLQLVGGLLSLACARKPQLGNCHFGLEPQQCASGGAGFAGLAAPGLSR